MIEIITLNLFYLDIKILSTSIRFILVYLHDGKIYIYIYKNKLNSSINEKKILRMFLRCLSLSCISIYVLLDYSRWIDLFDRNEWSTGDLNFWLVNSFIITIFLNIAYQTFPRAKHVFTAPLKKKTTTKTLQKQNKKHVEMQEAERKFF